MSNSAKSLTSHTTSHEISHATCQATSAFQPYFPSNKTKPCLINFSQKLNLSRNLLSNLSHNLSHNLSFSTILPLEKKQSHVSCQSQPKVEPLTQPFTQPLRQSQIFNHTSPRKNQNLSPKPQG